MTDDRQDSEATAAWSTGFTPDSDDLRPFPDVGEEWVDEQMRELIRAARAEREHSISPLPPANPHSK